MFRREQPAHKGCRTGVTHPRYADKDAALQGGLAHESSLVDRLGEAATGGRVLGVGPRRELVEIPNRGGRVRGQERTGLQTNRSRDQRFCFHQGSVCPCCTCREREPSCLRSLVPRVLERRSQNSAEFRYRWRRRQLRVAQGQEVLDGRGQMHGWPRDALPIYSLWGYG